MIDIFIKSYYKDFKFLNYCLKSIEKNVVGYNKIVLVIPEQDEQELIKLIDKHLKLKIELVKVKEYGNGYLFQQWIKISAYKYCSSEKIMYVDSDCIFHNYIDLSSIDKPEILYTLYSKVGDALCWKQPTENFMNEAVEFEFMRRNGLIYLRDTLVKINELKPNLENTIMSLQAFSEFNAMGAYAFKNEKENYSFVNTDEWTYTEPLVKQYWSWGGIGSVEDEIKALING
jgi:hypothetical protein